MKMNTQKIDPELFKQFQESRISDGIMNESITLKHVILMWFACAILWGWILSGIL